MKCLPNLTQLWPNDLVTSDKTRFYSVGITFTENPLRFVLSCTILFCFKEGECKERFNFITCKYTFVSWNNHDIFHRHLYAIESLNTMVICFLTYGIKVIYVNLKGSFDANW